MNRHAALLAAALSFSAASASAATPLPAAAPVGIDEVQAAAAAAEKALLDILVADVPAQACKRPAGDADWAWSGYDVCRAAAGGRFDLCRARSTKKAPGADESPAAECESRARWLLVMNSLTGGPSKFDPACRAFADAAPGIGASKAAGFCSALSGFKGKADLAARFRAAGTPIEDAPSLDQTHAWLVGDLSYCPRRWAKDENRRTECLELAGVSLARQKRSPGECVTPTCRALLLGRDSYCDGYLMRSVSCAGLKPNDAAFWTALKKAEGLVVAAQAAGVTDAAVEKKLDQSNDALAAARRRYEENFPFAFVTVGKGKPAPRAGKR
jgi:hypothetical protein